MIMYNDNSLRRFMAQRERSRLAARIKRLVSKKSRKIKEEISVWKKAVERVFLS